MTYHHTDCECGHEGFEGCLSTADCDLCACMPEGYQCRWEETWGDQYGGGIDACRADALGDSQRCARHGGSDLSVRLRKLAHMLRMTLTSELMPVEREQYRRVLDKLFTPCT